MFYWQQHYDPRNYYNHVTQTPYYPGCSLSCSQKQSFATQPQLQHPNYDHETFFGYIKHPTDALLVIEACIKGHLRPFDKPPTEMASLPIRSGTVMVLTDSSNGVKRWRDGVKWSPSRAYGPFLVYRQIEPQLNSNNKYQPSQSFNPQQHQQHISKDTIKEGDKVPTSVKLKSKTSRNRVLQARRRSDDEHGATAERNSDDRQWRLSKRAFENPHRR
ncbi:Gti1/Pac2 family-domain-containing protein [Obelidium mucronatum]|nr:Gti1/Pac2 family-domain-containing protein [Obelidium mucronatum]